MSGLIDSKAEISRLLKEMNKIEQEILVCEKKLILPAFRDKAPPDVVVKEQEKREQAKQLLEKRQQHLDMIKSL